jgi:heme oxygenase
MANITQQELRSIIQDLHSEAETTQLSQDLISGTIDAQIYKNMCYQMYLITDAIEHKIEKIDSRIFRRHQFVQDIIECPGGSVKICNSTREYIEYINNMVLPDMTERLKGAIYVFYMGWLYGGQMIAKKLTLPVNHLQFDNVKSCIDYIRTVILKDLTDQDAIEARRAFAAVIAIYRELYELH